MNKNNKKLRKERRKIKQNRETHEKKIKVNQSVKNEDKARDRGRNEQENNKLKMTDKQ